MDIINLSRLKFKPNKPEFLKAKVKLLRGRNFREEGKKFEKRVRKYFENKGYKIFKAENRHYDWLAIRGDKEYLIESKLNTARLSPAQEDFFAECLKKGKHYIIARRKDNGRIGLKRY